MLQPGKVKAVNGIALSSKLRQAQVSERMAEECQKALSREGYRANIDIQYDETSIQPGACLAIWAETETGCRLGADMAGKRGRNSEEIGRRVAHALLEDIRSGATVDRYLADQLIIYAALAAGTTEYLIPRLTEHIDSNLWLVEKFGAHTGLEGNRVLIEGIGHTRK
jgi:RNA 3'-terminal phosphate cyclase (ATP)